MLDICIIHKTKTNSNLRKYTIKIQSVKKQNHSLRKHPFKNIILFMRAS